MMEMARQRGDRIRKIGHTCVEVIRVLEDHSKKTGELLAFFFFFVIHVCICYMISRVVKSCPPCIFYVH